MLSKLNVDSVPSSPRMGDCAWFFSTSPVPSAQCPAPLLFLDGLGETPLPWSCVLQTEILLPGMIHLTLLIAFSGRCQGVSVQPPCPEPAYDSKVCVHTRIAHQMGSVLPRPERQDLWLLRSALPAVQVRVRFVSVPCLCCLPRL